MEVSWWRRYNVLIDGIARDMDIQLTDAAFRYHLALVGNGELTNDSFKEAQKQATGLYKELIGLVKPWQKNDAGVTSRQRMKEEYLRQIGDPNDPTVKQAIDAQLHMMQRQMAEAMAAPNIDDPNRSMAQKLAQIAQQTTTAEVVRFD